MDYMDTLRRGWALTWNNKWLWLLGFLAALGSGSSSFSNSSTSTTPPGSTPGEMSPELGAALVGGALVLICIVAIVGILLWLVSLAARGGLITAVSELARGETTGFGRSFRQGWRKVLPLVGMTILLFAIVIVLAIVLGIGFAGTIAAALGAGASGDSDALASVLGTAGIVFLCLLCLLIPLALVLNMIYAFAYRGMMLRNLGVMDAIRHGWGVLRANIGHVLVLGLIFFVISIIISLIAVAIMGLLGFSAGLFDIVLGTGEPTTTQLVTAGLGFLVAAIIFAIISAIVTAWRSATFTLAYEQWTGKDVLKDTAAPMPPATPMPPTMG